MGKTCAPTPRPLADLKTTPVYLGAGQETYRLPLPPSQTVSRGMGGEWAWGSDPLHNLLQMGQYPGRDYLSSLPRRGSPQPKALGPSAGQGRGPQK